MNNDTKMYELNRNQNEQRWIGKYWRTNGELANNGEWQNSELVNSTTFHLE